MKRVWAATYVLALSGHHQPTPVTANDNHEDEGAGLLLKRYAALLASGRFAEARKYWSDDGRASGLTESEFAHAHHSYAVISAEVGTADAGHVWAGSLFVDVALRLFGILRDGAAFDLSGPMTLRRVAGAGGAAASQRWKIVRSGLKPLA